MKCCVLYALLTPHDNEQVDLLHRLLTNKNIERIVSYKYACWCYVIDCKLPITLYCMYYK